MHAQLFHQFAPSSSKTAKRRTCGIPEDAGIERGVAMVQGRDSIRRLHIMQRSLSTGLDGFGSRIVSADGGQHVKAGLAQGYHASLLDRYVTFSG
jgi:hypothetical protein